MPTYPGFHPDFDVSQYPVLIQRAIREIARHFYVTRAFKSVHIGNSQYWAMLVRPTDEFAIYVNTDREIVVLFADYETLEIRTLEAYDAFYDLLESKRIDKSLRFLISGDSNVESTIKHYLNQHPEYPIIIPITFEALKGSSNNHILEAVRRNYLIRDLFGYQNPLREETYFFGRQNVVNSVLDMAKSGQNSSLFGLRKSGKTSVIYAIQRKARGFSCNVAVIDCQSPSVHARPYGSLLAYIISEVRKAIGAGKPAPVLGISAPEISENFTIHMNNALSLAKNSVLLIFDEIENISPRTAASSHWKEGDDVILFWQILRSYIQSESKGRLSVCIIGTSPSMIELPRINNIANPVYLYAQKKFIPNLTFDETREMVTRLGYFMGLEFPVEIIAELQKEYGGHPFFTRQVCSKIHQLASANRPIRVSSRALSDAKSEFSGQLESYLREIIEQLKNDYPEEFDILKSVISGDRKEVREFGEEAPELIDHLIGYGLIAREGKDFDIRFDAIRSALQHVVLKHSGEDRWAEISRRRNKIETDIRAALFYWCKSISSEQWSNIVTTSLTKSRIEKLRSSEPGLLFSKAESPLYLSDLLMFVKSEDVFPFMSDRRSLIVRSLDTINKLRKDAHAITVSDSDLSAAREAFDILEVEFGSA